MKTITKTRYILLGLMLMGATGASMAQPFSGSLSIRLSPGFPHANSIDFHYFPRANVYFSFSTGQYYYPAHGKWRHAPVLPRHFRLTPRERQLVRDYRRHGWRHGHAPRHPGHRAHRHHHRHGWDDGRRHDRGRHGGDRHRGERHRG